MRVYPPVTAHLFSDIVGYDSTIYGTMGSSRSTTTSSSPTNSRRALSSQFLNPTTRTDDVNLTVQPKLQADAEQALAGRDGAIVVLNPTTGAILAMYANPSFDPNLLASPSSAAQTQGRFYYLAKDPKASVPPTPWLMASRFLPDQPSRSSPRRRLMTMPRSWSTSPTPCRPRRRFLRARCSCTTTAERSAAGRSPRCFLPRATRAMRSSASTSGPPTCGNRPRRTGTTRSPRWTSPGWRRRTFRRRPNSHDNLPGLAYSSIGQEDVSATALQGALEAAAIANGGVIMKPHVMAQIRDAQGNVVANYGLQPWMRATTQATAAAITPLMEEVVTAGDRRWGRLLARGPGGGQDRDRPGRCQQPAGRRLDDRLRPGLHPGWRSPSRPLSAP